MAQIDSNNGEYGKMKTGVLSFKVIAVNPTLEELAKLNVELTNEPQYVSTGDNGEQKIRLDFWLKSDLLDNPTKVSFFLENKLVVSKNGKPQFINHYGNNTYADTIEEANSRVDSNGNPYFKLDGARQAYVGEALLIDFLKAWLDIRRNNKIILDNFAGLFNEDLSELKELIVNYNNLKVQAYLYVNDAGYQTVFNRYFLNGANPKKNVMWEKYFEKNPFENFYGVEVKDWDNESFTKSTSTDSNSNSVDTSKNPF